MTTAEVVIDGRRIGYILITEVGYSDLPWVKGETETDFIYDTADQAEALGGKDVDA
jgi:hypothetical protein